MRYNNGFQTISLGRGILCDLQLYDPKLYVWQDLDGYYYISYSRDNHERFGIEHARKEMVKRIETDTHEQREPDNRDLYDLMRNDAKYVSVDSIFNRAQRSQDAAKERMKQASRDEYAEAFYGMKLLAKRRPSLVE